MSRALALCSCSLGKFLEYCAMTACRAICVLGVPESRVLRGPTVPFGYGRCRGKWRCAAVCPPRLIDAASSGLWRSGLGGGSGLLPRGAPRVPWLEKLLNVESGGLLRDGDVSGRSDGQCLAASSVGSRSSGGQCLTEVATAGSSSNVAKRRPDGQCLARSSDGGVRLVSACVEGDGQCLALLTYGELPLPS